MRDFGQLEILNKKGKKLNLTPKEESTFNLFCQYMELYNKYYPERETIVFSNDIKSGIMALKFLLKQKRKIHNDIL